MEPRAVRRISPFGGPFPALTDEVARLVMLDPTGRDISVTFRDGLTERLKAELLLFEQP